MAGAPGRVPGGLIRDNDPLVYAQEYLAEFADWSGAAFFNREKLLLDGQLLTYPQHCDSIFAVIDTASKTGTDSDATAVSFFAYTAALRPPRPFESQIIVPGSRLYVEDFYIRTL